MDRQGTVRDSYRFGFDAQGTVQSWSYARFDYESWGKPKDVTQDGGHQDLFKVDPKLLQRWEGGSFDGDVKAYKYGDRWMSTSLQRWLSEDPSGLAFGTNPYEALNNSPYNYADPTGHIAPLIWAAIVIGSGATMGATHGILETYAANHNASGRSYLIGGGLGAISGAFNPLGELVSFAGAGIGGGIEVLNGGEFLGSGFQVGGLVGTLAGGFGRAGLKALTQGKSWAQAGAAGMRYVGPEFGGMAIGGAVGYYYGGTIQGALHGATLGMFGVGIGRGIHNLYDAARHGDLWASRGAFDNWLRKRGQWGREISAWHLNNFRTNSSRFYAVLSESAYLRLKSGGTPWPTGMHKANIGEGFYAWATRNQAAAYLGKKMEAIEFDPTRLTDIRSARISNRALASFTKKDLTSVSELEFQHFIDNHTLYEIATYTPHNFQYVVYPRGVGLEHFFDKTIFHHFVIR